MIDDSLLRLFHDINGTSMLVCLEPGLPNLSAVNNDDIGNPKLNFSDTYAHSSLHASCCSELHVSWGIRFSYSKFDDYDVAHYDDYILFSKFSQLAGAYDQIKKTADVLDEEFALSCYGDPSKVVAKIQGAFGNIKEGIKSSFDKLKWIGGYCEYLDSMHVEQTLDAEIVDVPNWVINGLYTGSDPVKTDFNDHYSYQDKIVLLKLANLAANGLVSSVQIHAFMWLPDLYAEHVTTGKDPLVTQLSYSFHKSKYGAAYNETPFTKKNNAYKVTIDFPHDPNNCFFCSETEYVLDSGAVQYKLMEGLHA